MNCKHCKSPTPNDPRVCDACESIEEASAKPAHNGPGPDLTGVQFVNPNSANPVTWAVLYYARNGDWCCREAEYGTTCHYHYTNIQQWCNPPAAAIPDL